MRILIFTIFINFILINSTFGAVGCTLNDPDRDVIRLFPQASNYKTDFITIKERGGDELYQEVEAKLGDELDDVYESNDVPYAYYTVLNGKETIGYVHGVNQRGRYGGMQLILATDPNGVIMDFYYQKLTGPESKKFRKKEFTDKFKGLCLTDFYEKDLREIIADPSEKSERDYNATFRGLKKNLILQDEFLLENKYDEYFYKDKKEGDPNEV